MCKKTNKQKHTHTHNNVISQIYHYDYYNTSVLEAVPLGAEGNGPCWLMSFPVAPLMRSSASDPQGDLILVEKHNQMYERHKNKNAANKYIKNTLWVHWKQCWRVIKEYLLDLRSSDSEVGYGELNMEVKWICSRPVFMYSATVWCLSVNVSEASISIIFLHNQYAGEQIYFSSKKKNHHQMSLLNMFLFSKFLYYNFYFFLGFKVRFTRQLWDIRSEFKIIIHAKKWISELQG